MDQYAGVVACHPPSWIPHRTGYLARRLADIVLMASAESMARIAIYYAHVVDILVSTLAPSYCHIAPKSLQ
jgi:hypothetical protein